MQILDMDTNADTNYKLVIDNEKANGRGVVDNEETKGKGVIDKEETDPKDVTSLFSDAQIYQDVFSDSYSDCLSVKMETCKNAMCVVDDGMPPSLGNSASLSSSHSGYSNQAQHGQRRVNRYNSFVLYKCRLWGSFPVFLEHILPVHITLKTFVVTVRVARSLITEGD